MSNADSFITVFQEWIDLFMHRSMHRFIQYTRKSGLSMSMIGAIFHLHHKNSVGVTDLGEHLGVTSAAASQMLERLVHWSGRLWSKQVTLRRSLRAQLFDDEQCASHGISQLFRNTIVLPVLHEDHRDAGLQIAEAILAIGTHREEGLVVGQNPSLRPVDERRPKGSSQSFALFGLG